ncbi:uncharacterized protein LOC110441345 [Mizuhopecten yessoensis]|uniref:Uncharacterized protein n=1 Tax=Mizuhopecten yessoensis TaxID=6573 RepID=A0A210PJK6_MIZYE|nr:uncharacterized protein LOC110441345 [Mizuhopecten yessoensis]OWF36665.1 hypothetical protein KP79_PYT03523 [Mizuhopecten yessoensis]
MSMSSRSLFLLKTRDLSVQDHSMNIEVMLAPNRTYLLMNKHKTLNAKSNKQKDKVEKQRDSSTHSYVSEKRLVDRRNQEFYIKRVNMFLNQLAPNTRSTVLDRKSFSPSLNKIQDDNKQASEAVKVVKTKVKPRVKSEPCTPRGSINSSFPLIPTDRRQSKSSVGFHERAKDKDVVKQTHTFGRSNVAVNGAYLTIQGSRFQNETRTKIQSSGSPVPEYFPPVSPTHNITRDVVTPSNQNPLPQTLTATGDKKPTIPFLSKKKVKFVSSKDTNGYKKWEETQNKEKQKTKYLDKRIEGFMLDQLRFNQANKISHYDVHRRNVDHVEDSKPTAKGNLVDMFDAFCQTGTKQQMHKLVKMAAKMKVKTKTPTSSTSMAPSIASFKNSQAFKRLNEVAIRS